MKFPGLKCSDILLSVCICTAIRFGYGKTSCISGREVGLSEINSIFISRIAAWISVSDCCTDIFRTPELKIKTISQMSDVTHLHLV